MFEAVANLFSRNVEKNTTPPEAKDRFLELSDLADSGFGWGADTSAGQKVSTNSALGVAVVLACARVIAESVAMLPVRVVRDLPGGGKERATNESEYDILSRWPNDWQTSFEFRETLTLHAVLTGNAFAIMTRGTRGQLLELLPVEPGCVSVVQMPRGLFRYRISCPARDVYGEFDPKDVFHLRGPSWDSVVGMDVVGRAREAIGLALAMEVGQSKLHANGVKTAGFVSFEKPMNPETVKRITEAWRENYSGATNAGKTPFLDNGAKWQSLIQSNADAQTIEQRKFQVEDICRAFRVSPHMIGATDKTSTYASAEQFSIQHVVYAIGPWVRRWEDRLSRDLFYAGTGSRRGLYVDMPMAALLRGDHASRSEFYSKMITAGIMTRNEIRLLEDLNPIPGLERPLVPQNMAYSDGSPVVVESATGTGGAANGN
jgi:HK97 family phage portal protein